MHFHLPKPLHGWREFVGEVGIIVVGVLIALGAEQVVETIHWQREAEHTREAISNELADHYATASEIVVAQPCIDQQLATLEQSLLKPGLRSPTPAIHSALGDFPYQAPTRVWADNVWKSAESEGSVSHLDNELRFRLSGYYTQLEQMRAENRATDLIAYRSRLLLLPLQPDAATRANLVQQIEEARGHFAAMKLLANQLMGQADDMVMRPPSDFVDDTLNSSHTLQYCRAHHLPLGKPEPQHGVAESVRSFERRRRH